MGREITVYESETKRTVSEVVDFLKQFAQWVGDQQLTVDQGDGKLVVDIPDNVVLEIKIEDEEEGVGKVKRSVEVEIEWIEEREFPTADAEEG